MQLLVRCEVGGRWLCLQGIGCHSVVTFELWLDVSYYIGSGEVVSV